MQKLTIFLFFSVFLFAACEDDPCEGVNCGANGTCDEATGACICDDFYEGDNCELEQRTKFIATWNSTSDCKLGSQNADPVWNFGTTTRVDAFILQSEDVLNNVIIEAVLTSPSEATIIPFSIGYSDFTGSITYINETTMRMFLSLNSTNQNLDCNYTMSR